MATITCTKCGAERETKRPRSAKYCHQCAALKEILYWTEERRRACPNCGVTVVPRRRCEERCGNCGVTPRVESCDLCSQPGEQWLPGLMVCTSCSSAPEKRADLVALLSRLKRERQDSVATPQRAAGPSLEDRRQAQIDAALQAKAERDAKRAAARGS